MQRYRIADVLCCTCKFLKFLFSNYILSVIFELHPFRKYFRLLQNQYGGHLQRIQLDRWFGSEKSLI